MQASALEARAARPKEAAAVRKAATESNSNSSAEDEDNKDLDSGEESPSINQNTNSEEDSGMFDTDSSADDI